MRLCCLGGRQKFLRPPAFFPCHIDIERKPGRVRGSDICNLPNPQSYPEKGDQLSPVYPRQRWGGFWDVGLPY